MKTADVMQFFIVLFPEDCYVSVSVCVCAHFCSFSFCSVVFQSFFMISFQPFLFSFSFLSLFLFSFSLFSCQFHFQSFFYV